MLAVHGQQVYAVFPDSVGDEVAAGDKALLVRQRQVVAALDGGQRGIQARNADDGIQHGARAVHRCQLPQAVRAFQQLRCVCLPCQRGGQLFKGCRVGDGNVLRVELGNLGQQLVNAGIGRQAEHLVAVHTADVQTLGADGSGGTQQGDNFTHFVFPHNR